MNAMTVFRLALIAGAALALAGCGGGSDGGSTSVTTPPPVVVPSLQSQFGTQFAVDFSASSTSTPPKPASGDIIPLSVTTAPIALH